MFEALGDEETKLTEKLEELKDAKAKREEQATREPGEALC